MPAIIRQIVKRALRLALLVALTLLPVSAAQRAITPIRVKIITPQNEVNVEMAEAVRVELRRLRDVAITYRNPAYEIQLNAMPIVSTKCQGFAAAVLVVEREGEKASLQAYTGATLQEVAKYVVATVDRENFARARERQ
jgi:hypothetical protein